MKNIEGKRLVVGNIPMSYGEVQLRTLFARAGTVASINVSVDPKTGRTRGFAVIEMETLDQANEAVKILDGATIDGRQLAVNRWQP